MKLLSFQIPEVAHLNPEDREAVLKLCLQSPRMQKYRRWTPRAMGGVMLALYATVLLLGLGMLAAVGSIMVALVFLLVLKMAGEVWVLRSQARRAIAHDPKA